MGVEYTDKKKDVAKKGGLLKVTEPKVFPQLNNKEWYVAKYESHSLMDGKFGPSVKLDFKILNGEDSEGNEAKGLHANALLSAEVNPKSKLYHFVQVFEGGRELELDEAIDLSAYYGKLVKVFVEDGKNKRDDGRPFQKITDVREYKKKV